MKKFSLLVLVPVFALFIYSPAFAGMNVGIGVSTGPLSFSYQDGGLYDDFGGRLQFVGRSHSGQRHSGHGYRGHSGRRHSGHGYKSHSSKRHSGHSYRGHSGHRHSRHSHGRHYGYSGLYLGLDLFSLFWPFSGLAYGYPYGYSYGYPYNYPYYGGGYYGPPYNYPPSGYYGPQQNYGGSNYNSSRENYNGEYDYQAYQENRPAEYGESPYDFRTFHEKRADEIEKRRKLSLQSDQEN